MKKQINVSLPLNVTELEMPLFAPFLTYELPPQKVKTLKNVFVTYTGFCIDRHGLVKASHHDHPHQLADFQQEAARYYYDATDHPDSLLTIDDNHTYLLIHHPWYNYYHWLMESIFRLWMVKEKKDKLILLLPDYYSKVDFIMGSLEPFAFKNVFFIPGAKSLLVKNLCMPQIKSKVDSYDYQMVAGVRRRYLDYLVNEKKNEVYKSERIYISRRKATRKRVENEEDIESILLKYNFTILNNEDYSFWEQVSIYSKAKYLVSMHGSGLTNMLFMQEGSSVLEFHKKQTNAKDWHSKAFWYQAEALGFRYYQQMCDPTDLEDDYFNANFIVDPSLLDKNLALMLADR